MMSSNKYIFVSEVLQQLKEDHFEISEKALEKLIRKYKIPSFKIDGRTCINFEDYKNRNETIKEELARLYATGKSNISKGQLRSKAIMRGIFKCIAAGQYPAESIVTFIHTEFANKQKEYGSPPANASELVEYVKGLIKAYEKISEKNLNLSSPVNSAVQSINALTPAEIEQIRRAIAVSKTPQEDPAATIVAALTDDEIQQVRQALEDQKKPDQPNGEGEAIP